MKLLRWYQNPDVQALTILGIVFIVILSMGIISCLLVNSYTS
jgi:hypothetical protein